MSDPVRDTIEDQAEVLSLLSLTLRMRGPGVCTDWPDAIDAVLAEREQLRAEVERLRGLMEFDQDFAANREVVWALRERAEKAEARVAELEGALDRIEKLAADHAASHPSAFFSAEFILTRVREERARLSGEPQPTPERP